MNFARRLLARRSLAALICAAALVLRLLVPTGYMIGSAHGRVTIELCPDYAPAAALAMPAMHGAMAHHHDGKHGAKADMPCAFAGAALAFLGAVDPIQLAILLAFIVAAAPAAPVRPVVRVAVRLRPPLRGPPAFH